MTCPSCNYSTPSSNAFCIRCGFPVAQDGLRLARIRDTVTWVFRRSLAGFASGMVGWWVIPAASRTAGTSFTPTAHLLLSGALGGIFLGAVEGMLEESALKTVRGGVAGLLGGLFGAWAATLVLKSSSASAGMAAVVVTWAAAGGVIGLASTWTERKRERILAAALAGVLGGALGGWLGYQMYASLTDIAKPEWGIKRLIEGTTGAILGTVLWFVIGMTEKLLVFKRRIARNISYKECDRCQHANLLKAWYCAACGAVLQVAAPPEKLDLPKHPALARFVAACQFLGRLTSMTSIVVAILAAAFLGPVNLFLGLFSLLAIALAGYIGHILFNALADALEPLL